MTRAQQTISIAMLLTSVRLPLDQHTPYSLIIVADLPRGIHGGCILPREDPKRSCACRTSALNPRT